MYMGRVNGAAVLYIIHGISARINKYLYTRTARKMLLVTSPRISPGVLTGEW